MDMPSFKEKEIELAVVLGKGTFGGSGNTKIIKGLAVQCEIEKVMLPDKNKAKVEIYGLNLDDMEQMTTLAFKPLETQKNYIQIKAGDKDGELSLVFKGEIATAYANFNNVPDIVFEIEALAGYFPALKAIPATSATGEVSIAELLAKLAKEAGYGFVNKGVTGAVSNPYLTGSPFEQIKKMAADNGFDVLFDDEEIIAVPFEKARSGNTVKLSKDTGLIGYPTFSSEGISLACHFEKELQIGGLVEVDSMVPKASGVWKVSKLSHKISANFAGTNFWESAVDVVPYK